MCAYVFNAKPFMIQPSETGLTNFTAVNARESTPPIDQGLIMPLNSVTKDMYPSQENGRAVKHIIQSWPDYILQTVKDLIDYLTICAKGSPEWPGPLRGK